jgi:signal transduction histidine kinase
MGNRNRPEERSRSRTRPHEEFLELCAVSTAGELSQDEQKELHEHLAICPECRQALEEFEAVASVGAPLLSSALIKPDSHESASAPTKVDVTAGAGRQAKNPKSESGAHEQNGTFILARHNGHGRSRVNGNYIWVPFAAAVLLAAALGIYSYQAGTRHGSQIAQTASTANADAKVDALEQQLSDAGHEREVLQSQLAGRDRLIRDLRHQVESESAALSEAQNAAANLQRSIQNDQAENQQLAQQQSDLRQKLGAVEGALATTQTELASAQQERREEQLAGKSLEAQINDLNAQLRLSEQKIGKQDDLLSDDRDIRDLMGARDLYIAEVYDVARDGATRKPYGRIFYTKGKSLVFYAYDLDQQPGVKNASTFQAWGQRGADRQQAINLGIFYQDSKANKRWVLKFDDPRKLDQINAVFVTVEPRGGSHTPNGKALLFASLRIEANHP